MKTNLNRQTKLHLRPLHLIMFLLKSKCVTSDKLTPTVQHPQSPRKVFFRGTSVMAMVDLHTKWRVLQLVPDFSNAFSEIDPSGVGHGLEPRSKKPGPGLSIPIGSMGREYLPTFTISSIHVGKYSSPMDPKRDWILVVSLSGSQNVKVYEIIPIPVSSKIVCKNWCRHSPFRKPTLFWGAEIL